MLFNDKNGNIHSIELKAETKEAHGNFFLETWSNMNFGRKKEGWMRTLNADFLFYYFIDVDQLYSIKFERLWEWAWIKDRIKNYPLKPQDKYDQLNKTMGRCVPIEVIKKEVGFNLFYPREELRKETVSQSVK